MFHCLVCSLQKSLAKQMRDQKEKVKPLQYAIPQNMCQVKNVEYTVPGVGSLIMAQLDELKVLTTL